MISDTSQYIFLKVPLKWKEIYTKMLILMSNQGIDMIKDCKGGCSNNAKSLINCWNVFNAACAAYANNEIKEAQLLITLVIDCLNTKHKINFDLNYYKNIDVFNYPMISSNNSTLFIDYIKQNTGYNNLEELIAGESVNSAKDLLTEIDGIIDGYFKNYAIITENSLNRKYIVGDDYLIYEDVIYDDLYIIRLFGTDYKLKSITYSGGFNDNIIYDRNKNININLHVFENIPNFPMQCVYIYYNNDKSIVKNIKVELTK